MFRAYIGQVFAPDFDELRKQLATRQRDPEGASFEEMPLPSVFSRIKPRSPSASGTKFSRKPSICWREITIAPGISERN